MLALYRLIAAALLCLVLPYMQSCQAHSIARNPLAAVIPLEEARLVSPAHQVHARSVFNISFALSLQHDRYRFRLALEPNRDVLASAAVVRYAQHDGSVSAPMPIDPLAYKVFRGQAYVYSPSSSTWLAVGWARITVLRDGNFPIFEGAFAVAGDTHHVKTAERFRQLRRSDDPDIVDLPGDSLIVWRDSDIMAIQEQTKGKTADLRRKDVGQQPPQVCGSESLAWNTQLRQLRAQHPSVISLRSTPLHQAWERQIDGTPVSDGGVNLLANIGSTLGCPIDRKVALLGIATDCTYTASFGSDQATRQNIITQVNLASELYERTFNISLGIQELHISNATCPDTPPADTAWNTPCSSSTTLLQRLNIFSAWRGQRQDNNALWILLSTCNSGPAVGLSWLSQLCVKTAHTSQGANGAPETVSGANVVVRTDTEWKVLAHEIGHSFGAVHDCISETCSGVAGSTASTTAGTQCCPMSRSQCDAGGAYIMNPSTGASMTDFSACSIGNICGDMRLGAVQTSCLVANNHVDTITGKQCGNGIVEPGEDCDCGGVKGCGNNPCCNAATCKFEPGATCDLSNDKCCTGQCGIATSGTVCRASTSVCDPIETCDGSSATCPTDKYLPNGSSCGSSMACAQGQCTSRDLQCRSVVGVNATDGATYACSDTSTCQICCVSETFSSTAPHNINQNFLAGTTCSSGGMCEADGSCDGGSITSEFSQWISENMTMLVPLVAVVGGLIVLTIGLYCLACIRRRIGHNRDAHLIAGPPTAFISSPAKFSPAPVSFSSLPRRPLPPRYA